MKASPKFARALGLMFLSAMAGTAEETGLAANSIDLVVAAQAFHWFDPDRAGMEFQRILQPGGWVALVWNERLVGASPFLREYEELLKGFATDYSAVDHRNVGEKEIAAFFHPGSFAVRTFSNRQEFDFEGLKGRCLSSSYTLREGGLECDARISELKDSFNRHQGNGKVAFEYKTNVYFGRLPE